MIKMSLISILLLSVLSPRAGATDYVPQALVMLGDGIYFSNTAIVVDKSQRKLTVWESQDGAYVKKAEFPSDLGRQDGPKIARGDKRTPEGVYFLEKLLEGASLSFQEYGIRAFTTNYPNLFDIRDGKTGDGIWLHAVPDKVSLQRGSRGCVVVRNDAILEVSRYIRPGHTPIVISNEINQVPFPDLKKSTENFVSLFESWHSAWQSKDIEKYISFYDTTFEAQKMGRDKWKTFKSGLNEKYQNIHIEFSKPLILAHRGRVIIKALQKYKSDYKEDFGEKTIYLENKDGAYKIVSEEWAPVENTEALQTLLTTRSAANTN